jgi:hypothetical protein
MTATVTLRVALRSSWPWWQKEAAAVAAAGLVAGTLATVAQVLLWAATGEDVRELVLRDSRLTAALLLGTRALTSPAGPTICVLLAATGVHFGLSVLYAGLLLPVANRLNSTASLLAGALVGALLYFLNLYVFAALFPWFAEARGGITLAAHVVFGVSVMIVLRLAK